MAELAAVAVPDLLRLFAGEVPAVAATLLDFERRLTAGEVTAGEFIATVDRYFYQIATLADLALRGYPHLVV